MLCMVIDTLLPFQGMPNDGSFRKMDDIVLVCSAIIFTCSAQHATLNFGQYEIFSYIPNYPSLLKGQPPINLVCGI